MEGCAYIHVCVQVWLLSMLLVAILFANFLRHVDLRSPFLKS